MELQKQVFYPDSNRVGKFNILHETLRDGRAAPWLRALFGLCVVLDVSENESGRGKTYIASSDLFQPLNEGDEIPEYRIDMAAPGVQFSNDEHEARRVDAGGFGFVAIRQNIVRVPPVQLAAGLALPGRVH